MNASEKVAYLRGLADGLGIDKASKEGKLFLAAMDVLDSFAADIEDLERNSSDLADAIDDIGEDMAYLEDLCIGSAGDYEDDDDDGDDGFVCGGDCSTCTSGCDETEYEVTCPECGKVINLFEDDLAFGSTVCPECGESIELDTDGEDEE